jgi:hypothetical protein
VREKITPAMARMLDPLIIAYPGVLTNAELAAAAGVSESASTFRNIRSSLSSLGAVTYPGSGQTRAADWLFPAIAA